MMSIPMGKTKSLYAFLSIIMMVLGSSLPIVAQAACSSYTRFATINELWRQSNNQNTRDYFYEVKALDQSIVTSGEYRNWTLEICRQRDGRCTSAGMNSASLVCSGNENYLRQYCENHGIR